MSAFTALADLLDPPTPQYQWECTLPNCDGQPHDTWTYPHARTKQRLPKGNWTIWLLLLGRGWGKTRTGSESFLELILQNPTDLEGLPTEWLIAGQDYDDTISNCIEGPSGFIAACRRQGLEPRWTSNRKRLVMPGGQRIHITHGEDENLGRGKNLSGAWLDEMGTWKRVLAPWAEGLRPAVRRPLPSGKARIIITTTPKLRSVEAMAVLKQQIDRAEAGDPSRIVTKGSTFENEANIPEETLQEWLDEYPEGSKLYRQELLGEITDEIEGALWQFDDIDQTRVTEHPPLIRKIVAIDPAVTSGPDSDETGIVLVGKAMVQATDMNGRPRQLDHYYVLADHTARVPMNEWAETAVRVAANNTADILIEVDQGGDLAVNAVKDAAVRLGVHCPTVKAVRAASVGSKAARANPVAALYKQDRVHHVGVFDALEGQMVSWVPEQSKKSPDRIDALVWAVSSLKSQGQVTSNLSRKRR